MTDTLELDYETHSETNIKAGLDRYSSCPSTTVLMGAYALNGGPFVHWEAHKAPVPAELREALLDPKVERWAFNAQFERVITRRVLKINTPTRGWRCGMVLASLQGFAGSLDKVGEWVGLADEYKKDKAGHDLIKIFSIPHKPTKANPRVRRDWNTDPELWETFCQYNVKDCIAERAIRALLSRFPIPESEWELYELDQQINDRGLPVDRGFVEQAIIMAARRKAELTEQMRMITLLENPGSTGKLLGWLKNEGYWFDDLQKATVAKAVALDKADGYRKLTNDARDVLALRQWQASTSVAKYPRILEMIIADDRLRFAYLMGGAGRTARWAGRGVQTQNLKSTPKSLADLPVLDECNRIIRAGDYDGLGLYIREPMEALAGVVRSFIRARPGHQILACDLSSIESAGLGFLAQSPRLLNVFKEGRDPYKDFATEFYRKPYEEVTRAERGICKPPTLGCGYRLGGGNMRRGKRTGLWGYAEAMGVDMPREEAHRAVKVFRAAYPEIPKFWLDIEDAIAKTLTTGRQTEVQSLRFEYRKPYLMMWLPTGRPLYYFKPALRMVQVPTGKSLTRPSRGLEEDGAPKGELIEYDETYEKLSFTYMGKQQMTNAWVRIASHGGKTTEQATQAMCRDILKMGLLRAGRAGWPIIGHSHDEIFCEVLVGDDRFTVEKLRAIMIEKIEGLEGMPLGAAGYTSNFYRKD